MNEVGKIDGVKVDTWLLERYHQIESSISDAQQLIIDEAGTYEAIPEKEKEIYDMLNTAMNNLTTLAHKHKIANDPEYREKCAKNGVYE